MIINNEYIKVKRFSSKEMKLVLNDYLRLVENNQVTIIYKNEESIFELFLICKLYEDANVKVNLILTYLPYQRMDHNNGVEAPTLQYVASLFNCLNLNSLKVCEPHCSLTYFNNAEQIDVVEKIYQKIKSEINFDEDKDCLIFTDKGSKNKYSKLAKNYVYFEKSRDINTGLICSHKMIGEINENAKAILIDDIISSGDTICSCLDNIKNDLYIICGHIENNKYNERLIYNKKIKTIYSTNSLRKRQKGNLRLFNIEEFVME